MPTFPSSLPAPTQDGYGIEPDDHVGRTHMESGTARSRKNYTTTPTRFPVKWTLTWAQFEVFRAWHRADVADGASWFDIQLWNGLGISTYSARFIGMWRSGNVRGQNIDVTAVLEVSSRPILTAAELEVAVAYPVEEIAYGSPVLHTLIHTTLPASYW